MVEAVLVGAIVGGVAVWACCSFYRTLTGKKQGCACGGKCGCAAGRGGCRDKINITDNSQSRITNIED